MVKRGASRFWLLGQLVVRRAWLSDAPITGVIHGALNPGLEHRASAHLYRGTVLELVAMEFVANNHTP